MIYYIHGGESESVVDHNQRDRRLGARVHILDVDVVFVPQLPAFFENEQQFVMLACLNICATFDLFNINVVSYSLASYSQHHVDERLKFI